MKSLRLSIITCLLAFGSMACGQALADPEGLQPIEDGAPVLPDASDPSLEPEVTIKRDDRGMVKEYRINGALYKIEVVPDVGPPYYLVDEYGTGQWTRLDLATNPLVVPQWVLIRF